MTTIREGIRIHFGLFYEIGWIEILDSGGERIGWFDLKKVDIDSCIDAILAACH